ncbi:MAG TPA: porin, partial [Terriglobia bacterium]|nr:porin [Terriglobia bacterium]
RIAELEELVRRQSERLETLLAPAPSPVPVLPPPVPDVQEKTAEVAKAPPVEPEKKVTAPAPTQNPVNRQISAIKFNGLLQAWYAHGQGVANTFRIRRTELYFNGEINGKARWQVMVDPAKALLLDTSSTTIGGSRLLTEVAVSQSSRILQNAFITLDYIPKLQFNIGQYKLPLSLEGLQSPGELDTVERALFASDRARGGNYGDVRDIGLTGRGGLGRRVDFQVGVFNGIAETQNDIDRNSQKALVGRMVARPVTGLQVGFSGAFGASGRGTDRDRLGAEFLFTRGALRLKSELMTGEDGPLHRRGFYGHLGYRLRPRLEAVVRVDTWDPDTATELTPASVRELDYVTGLNVFLSEHLKLQVNYLRKTFGNDLLSPRNVLLVNTQAFW